MYAYYYLVKTATNPSKDNDLGMTGSNFRGTSKDQLKPSQSIKVMPGSNNPLSTSGVHG